MQIALPQIITDKDEGHREMTYTIRISREMADAIQALKDEHGHRAVNRWLQQIWKLGIESSQHLKR